MYSYVILLTWWRCANLNFITFILIHTPSLTILLLINSKFLNYSLARICQWISANIWTTMKLIVSSLSLLVLSFLWAGVLSCNRCFETYVEAKLPFGHGSCEIKLWRFCPSSSPWIGGQISKSWTYIGIQTFRLKTLEMRRMISTSAWLWSRLPTAQLMKSGKGWDVGGWLAWSMWIGFIMFFFKMTMATNNESGLKEVSKKNLVTWLWAKITSSCILKIKLSKFIKLAKITCVQVLGSIKDEQCFLVMAFVKNKLRTCFLCHLDNFTQFYVQWF